MIDAESLGFAMFERETETGSRAVRLQQTVLRRKSAIEQHRLDADVIVKVLDVAGARRHATEVTM